MWADTVRAFLDAIAPPQAPVEEPKPALPSWPPQAPSDPGNYLILLAEATRTAEGQRSAVDELRTRSSLILAAIALIAAFMGPEKRRLGWIAASAWGADEALQNAWVDIAERKARSHE